MDERVKKALMIYRADPKRRWGKAMLEAGYSPSYTKSFSTQALRSALRKEKELIKETEKEVLESGNMKELQLVEKLNYTREQVLEEYKHIMDQRKDMNAKMRALNPLLKEQFGIDLYEQDTQQVPQLNIGFIQTTDEPIKGEVIDITHEK